MSFLLVSKHFQVERESLAKLLCPYQGPVESLELPLGYVIYASSLCEIKEDKFSLKLPRGHQQEPHSAWCEITENQTRKFLKLLTDPFGQCPLWIFESMNGLIITTEAKSLMAVVNLYDEDIDRSQILQKQKTYQWKSNEEICTVRPHQPGESPFKNIKRVRSGAELSLDLENQSITYTLKPYPWNEVPPTLAPGPSPDGASEEVLEYYRTLLETALTTSLKAIPATPKTIVFLSGGIDSSVATVLCRQRFSALSTQSLGTRLGNEFDASDGISTDLKVPNLKVIMQDQELFQAFKRVIYENELTDGLTAEILLQLECLSAQTKGEGRQVVTGYGADLLFGGMLQHKAYMKATGVFDTPSLMERALWSGEFSPFYYWKRGQRFFHLFWHPSVVRVGMQIPTALNFCQDSDKHILRSLAAQRGWIQSEKAFRSKMSMTNGTRVHEILSGVLGFTDPYGYQEKTRWALTYLKAELAR
ncbi:MAG: hypothetical protein IPK04_07200 [Bdellovibrionales bacterium]|nr:hypothetical protein [Bdellovibrionales bacterium]